MSDFMFDDAVGEGEVFDEEEDEALTLEEQVEETPMKEGQPQQKHQSQQEEEQGGEGESQFETQPQPQMQLPAEENSASSPLKSPSSPAQPGSKKKGTTKKVIKKVVVKPVVRPVATPSVPVASEKSQKEQQQRHKDPNSISSNSSSNSGSKTPSERGSSPPNSAPNFGSNRSSGLEDPVPDVPSSSTNQKTNQQQEEEGEESTGGEKKDYMDRFEKTAKKMYSDAREIYNRHFKNNAEQDAQLLKQQQQQQQQQPQQQTAGTSLVTPRVEDALNSVRSHNSSEPGLNSARQQGLSEVKKHRREILNRIRTAIIHTSGLVMEAATQQQQQQKNSSSSNSSQSVPKLRRLHQVVKRYQLRNCASSDTSSVASGNNNNNNKNANSNNNNNSNRSFTGMMLSGSSSSSSSASPSTSTVSSPVRSRIVVSNQKKQSQIDFDAELDGTTSPNSPGGFEEDLQQQKQLAALLEKKNEQEKKQQQEEVSAAGEQSNNNELKKEESSPAEPVATKKKPEQGAPLVVYEAIDKFDSRLQTYFTAVADKFTARRDQRGNAQAHSVAVSKTSLSKAAEITCAMLMFYEEPSKN